MRVGVGDMAQQYQVLATLLKVQRQVRDKWKPCAICADQAGKRMLSDQRRGLWAIAFEMGR